MVDVAHPSDIEQALALAAQVGDGFFEAFAEAEGFAEVAARAATDIAEGGGRVDGAVVLEKAVDHFVVGAVAAHGDDQVVAVLQGEARQLGGLPGLLCKGEVDLAQLALKLGGDAWPFAAGRSVGRIGIDDEVGALRARHG